MSQGKFITLEGIDGAGKSTHLSFIAERLRAKGRQVVVTREPGGTPLGEMLRGIAPDRLQALENWVQSGLQPDITLLFDVPLEISRERLSHNMSLDRFEQEKQDFFARVRAAYLDRAAATRQRRGA